jgi:hypothetical protein
MMMRFLKKVAVFLKNFKAKDKRHKYQADKQAARPQKSTPKRCFTLNSSKT